MEIIDKTLSIPPAFHERAKKDTGQLYFDIESTGLNKQRSYVYLLGALWWEDGQYRLRQYFAEKPADEKEILESFFDLCSAFDCIVHYNGDSFDLPYIRHRAAYYDLVCRLPGSSLDLYRHYSPLKKLLKAEDLKLTTLEAFAGYERRDRHTGKELIKVYDRYLQTGDALLKEKLLLHNYDDLAGLIWLQRLYSLLAMKNKELKPRDIKAVADMKHRNLTLICFYDGLSFPEGLSWEAEGIKIRCTDGGSKAADGFSVSLLIPFYEGRLYHYFKDYKNYYYLPAEDRALHKSVAMYVDAGAREKAKKETAYVPKEGLFLPQFKELHKPAFRRKGDPASRLYFLYEDAFSDDPERLKDYAVHMIAEVGKRI